MLIDNGHTPQSVVLHPHFFKCYMVRNTKSAFFVFVLLIDTMLDYGFIQKVSPSHDMNCTILTYRIYEL